MSRTRPPTTVMLLAFVLGCGTADDDQSAGPIVTDSAGVRIADVGDLRDIGWRVDSLPILDVGWGAADPEFEWIRSGRILPDGAILLGDSGSGVVYKVDPNGEVVARWGRTGEGPGEYQAIETILVEGDSVLIADSQLQRLTVLSLSGEVLHTRQLPGQFIHRVSSIQPDGRLVLVPGEIWMAPPEVRQEWVFEHQPVIAATTDGTVVDTLAMVPHLRRWYGTRGGSPGPIAVKGRAEGLSDGFVWARADVAEVRWHATSGGLLEVVRWTEDPTPLSVAFQDEYARGMLRAMGGRASEAQVAAQRQRLQEEFNRYDGPLPYWDALVADRDGNAWLRDYATPTQPSRRWRVIAKTGPVGWVDLPNVFAVLDVTTDEILAVRLDDLGISGAVLLPLTR